MVTLAKPVAGDTDWAGEINQNWTDIENELNGATLSAYKSADETHTGVVLQDDSHLVVALSANSRYSFRIFVFDFSSETGGLQLGLGGTAGVGSLKAQISIWNDQNDRTNVSIRAGRVTAFNTGLSGPSASATLWATVEGSIETTTAGTFRLMFAGQSSFGTITVQRGSYMICRKHA